MSLSARDRHALGRIENELAASDPDLAAKLAAFSRIAEGEEMPEAERSRGGWWRVISGLTRWLRGARGRRQLAVSNGWRPAVLVIWLATTCALIAVAVATSHLGTGGQCAALVPAHCGDQLPASTSHQGPR